MVVVAAGIDADAAAVGLARQAAATWTADAAAADSTCARIGTGSAVIRIGGEVAAEVDRAAVLESDRAIGADALAITAVDGHQIAGTDLATDATVFEIGLQVDTGPCLRTERQPGITPCSGGIVLRGRRSSRAGPGHSQRCQECDGLAA
jgi:hypothetical protein